MKVEVVKNYTILHIVIYITQKHNLIFGQVFKIKKNM
jgi:hypothetical protein